MAQKAIRDSVDNSQQQQQQSNSRSTSQSTTSKNTNTIESAQNYIRIFLVLNALLYFIPFSSSFSFGSYRRFNYTAIINYGMSLYFAHGIPQFNMAYAQKLLMDATTMYDEINKYIINSINISKMTFFFFLSIYLAICF